MYVSDGEFPLAPTLCKAIVKLNLRVVASRFSHENSLLCHRYLLRFNSGLSLPKLFVFFGIRIRIEAASTRRNRGGKDRQNRDDEQDRANRDAVLIVKRSLRHAADSADKPT